jgi:hypothetical protein
MSTGAGEVEAELVNFSLSLILGRGMQWRQLQHNTEKVSDKYVYNA